MESEPISLLRLPAFNPVIESPSQKGSALVSEISGIERAYDRLAGLHGGSTGHLRNVSRSRTLHIRAAREADRHAGPVGAGNRAIPLEALGRRCQQAGSANDNSPGRHPATAGPAVHSDHPHPRGRPTRSPALSDGPHRKRSRQAQAHRSRRDQGLRESRPNGTGCPPRRHSYAVGSHDRRVAHPRNRARACDLPRGSDRQAHPARSPVAAADPQSRSGGTFGRWWKEPATFLL